MVGDILSATNIVIMLLAGAVKFVYTRLEKDTKDLKEGLENRIDKLEENSRRDDDNVKELIVESEARMSSEITARIRNIVELHQKTEKINETLSNKIELLIDRIAKLEGRNDINKGN